MLNRDSLAKQVYTQLKKIILLQNTDGFRMGDKLSESLIAEMFDCSITPVRESLNMLRRDGLVVGTSYRSSSVVTFTSKEVEELFELRTCLEVFALKKVMSQITEEDLDVLRKAQEQFRESYLHFNESGIVGNDRMFHGFFTAKAGNALLQQNLADLSERISMVQASNARRRKETGDLEYLLLPVREHDHILTALENRQPDEACAAMEAHLRRMCRDTQACYT